MIKLVHRTSLIHESKLLAGIWDDQGHDALDVI